MMHAALLTSVLTQTPSAPPSPAAPGTALIFNSYINAPCTAGLANPVFSWTLPHGECVNGTELNPELSSPTFYKGECFGGAGRLRQYSDSSCASGEQFDSAGGTYCTYIIGTTGSCPIANNECYTWSISATTYYNIDCTIDASLISPSVPPSSPPPAPPATPTSTEDPCFPSSALVTKADGTVSRVDKLREGDEILAATAEGGLATDTVSLLSLAQPGTSAPSYVVLTTAANRTLTLTPGHHVPVGATCCAVERLAKDVAVGETVWAVRDGAVVGTAVTSKSTAKGVGLHSPVLTNGGFPIVDGIVTAFDSIDRVLLAKHGLAPLLAACKATGTCNRFRETFLQDGRAYIR